MADTSNALIGYMCCALAVVMFGTNFIPVKKIDAKDGIWFGWCMSLGIMVVAIIVDLSPLTTKPHKYDPWCLFGGATWAAGNVAGPLIIQKIGMGMAVTVWGLTNMLMGWATGRFGFFGIEKQTVENDMLNYAGVAIALCAGVVFGLVTPEEQADEPLLKGEASSKAIRRTLSSTNNHAAHEEHGSVGGTVYAIAFAGALAAGFFFGSMFDIATLKMQDAPGNGFTDKPLDFVLTQASGIFVAYTIVLGIYSVVMGEKRYIAKEVIVPAAISGAMWCVAFTAWNKANGDLQFVISFPIITTGPSVVGMTVGMMFYGEIKTTANRVKVAIAFALAIGGVVAIALSKGGG